MNCDHAKVAVLQVTVTLTGDTGNVLLNGVPASEPIDVTYGWWCRDCGALMKMQQPGEGPPRWALPARE